MANYDNLPVYKATYDLLLTVFKTGQHWSRDIKFTLGEELKKGLLALMVDIYKANTVVDKTEYLDRARTAIAAAKIQIRLLFDLKQMPLKQYAHISEMAESVSKQLAAWDKYQKTKTIE